MWPSLRHVVKRCDNGFNGNLLSFDTFAFNCFSNKRNGARSLTTSQTYQPIIPDSERARSVTSFYFQTAIDQAASKPSVRLMPTTMLYSGRSADGSHLLRSAQYLQRELPIRLAHRITGFRQLPFIVGCNPDILSVHELYIKAFHLLNDFSPVADLEDELKFSQALTKLLDEHKDVISILASGFKQTKKHIQDDSLIKNFLDNTLASRLATRMLCEHHLFLHEEKPNQIGIIAINFSLKTLIEKKIEFTRKMCEDKFGISPEVHLAGHVMARFAYIPQPLDYILHELLKNAMRATVEFHPNVPSDRLPPVVVTLVNNEVDFIIRISDRGGGIRHNLVKKVWDYGFSSESDYHQDRLLDLMSENRAFGKLHGYGFGLPACKAYVEYLGGTIEMETMQGFGTDVYVRLGHIDGKGESFRI